MNQTILELNNISKTYPGVKALDKVSLSFRRGEVHALVGENGAGKSTLIKTISGAEVPDSGSILVNGKEYTRMTPVLAMGLGIQVIYQEFNLVTSLSAAENICLGNRYGRLVNYRHMNEVAKDIFNRFAVHIDPTTLVRDLSTSQQQIVEIAKAVSRQADLLIMDEPTAPLTMAEVGHLFSIIRQLKAEGATIVYISHRLDEIFELADRVSVLRDGMYIATRDAKDTSRQELIRLMVGRELSDSYPARNYSRGPSVLELKGLTGNGDRNISFSVHKGEILGLSGMVGAGRTELAKMLYGAAQIEHGEIILHGKPQKPHSPRQAMQMGVGLIPEDRKTEGCFLEQSIEWNISIASIRKVSKGLFVSSLLENKQASEYRDVLNIKTPSLEQQVKNLSGGNQQKVALAKTLATNSDIIIFDEPTRGIDVGAKQEIYQLMNDLTIQGKSILMITSDMEELLGMADRIAVLCEGQLAGIVEKSNFSQEHILDLASGGSMAV